MVGAFCSQNWKAKYEVDGRARDTKVKSHTLGVLTIKKAEKEKKKKKAEKDTIWPEPELEADISPPVSVPPAPRPR